MSWCLKMTKILDKGPKYSHEPVIAVHELLALNRRVSKKATSEDQERCLLEGVDALGRTANKVGFGKARDPTRSVVSFFQENDFRLMQSDKEGRFVVFTGGVFNDKAQQAITKNFVPVKAKATRVKKEALALCKELNLSDLVKPISECKGDSLGFFFTAKSHKENIPFPAIVSERGSWQQLVSRFLLKHLKRLKVDDPFITKCSKDVISYLQGNASIAHGFSVDVTDLFYSVPQQQMFASVRDCIDRNGVVDFQNLVGMSVDNFMVLLEFHLKSTFISFNEELYVQR